MLNLATHQPETIFEQLRRTEFARLERSGVAYLDYTGSAVYTESQVREHQRILLDGLFGNPHSASAPSQASSAVIAGARELVLRHFDVDASTHEVIFTANTSAAIKLVAESYRFSTETTLVLSADNHNSVNGLREYARRAGARVCTIRLDDELRMRHPSIMLGAAAGREGGLFAFPAQSNFSGVQHPLSLIERAHELGFDVLLDVAAYAPSHALSLRDCQADFAALSFYKMFGYPTGVGALIARRSSLERLRRPWFAGGTVLYASVAADRHLLRAGAEGFEDGTPSFLALSALPAGFALLDQLQMSRIQTHVRELTSVLLEELLFLRHDNGAALVRLYGPADHEDRGGTVAMNLLDRDGQIIPYQQVEAQAVASGIAIRGGCFCNPGASEAAFQLRRDQITSCFDRLGGSFTPEDFSACSGTEVGAVRVSIGAANNLSDLTRLISFLANFRKMAPSNGFA